MELYIQQIVHRVKVYIDEIALNDAEFVSGEDNSDMNAIIIHKIKEALRYVMEHADWQYLEPNKTMTNTTDASSMTIDSNKVGHLKLPDGFIRLCYAKFASWTKYVSDLIYWNDSEYAMLSDTYSTGTPERPKVAMVMTPEKTLEMYSAKTNDEAWSVGLVVVDNTVFDTDSLNESVEVPEKLEPAFINYLSGLVCVTYKWDNAATNFFTLANSYMGITSTEK